MKWLAILVSVPTLIALLGFVLIALFAVAIVVGLLVLVVTALTS